MTVIFQAIIEFFNHQAQSQKRSALKGVALILSFRCSLNGIDVGIII